ncbi:MAG TPA: M23 family metallopeptidase [Pseudolabrys sp.]|nr:M23 family metallopeptidase [Pseudolabrys sp.]
MLRAVAGCLALLIALPAAAQELTLPRITVAKIDWKAAAAGLAATGLAAAPDAAPAQALAPLNAAAGALFSDIAKSPVPVLLPFDAEGFAKARTAASPDAPATAETFLQGGFQPTRFFLAGPGGYDTAFSLATGDVKELSDIRYRDPVYVMFSGLAALYELDGPPLPGGDPVKDLDAAFPGIRRYLHESYVRYAFERYGVTYVASIYCLDRSPRARILTCRQADRILVRFLQSLKLAGGAPQPETFAPAPLARPEKVSPDFTYYSPGFLIPGTGVKGNAGVADYTVYANLRYPMKEAPSFANSQSFNNWGNCDFTGRSPRRLGKKGMSYSCKVNGLPLTFDESAGANYSYPWRDNFCEHRFFLVGQCPAGRGHQGQDIRAGSCKQFNEGADRCLPYQHDVVAAHDGMVLRVRKQEALYLFVNGADAHLRLRYIHMNPKRLDADGVVTGRQIREGEAIGQVGTYERFERGTTYHLHFDMQVPTKVGWVFVNPYMTLVAAYERLIGARGSEIKPGDPVPPLATVPPVIEHAPPLPTGSAVPLPPLPPAQIQQSTAESAKALELPRRKHRYARRKRAARQVE